LAFAAIPLAIAGTALSAGTAIYGGIQQANTANANAQIASQNAAQATNEVNIVNQQSSDEQLQKYRQIAAVRGQQTASAAAGGLNVGFGTPSGVIQGTQIMGEEDAQRIRNNMTNEANGYVINAANYTTQAAEDKSQASADLAGGFLKGAGTIFQGASQIAGKNSAPTSSNGFAGQGNSNSWMW
jgi:hypothetical protein